MKPELGRRAWTFLDVLVLDDVIVMRASET
jgi:hypothetical protein